MPEEQKMSLLQFREDLCNGRRYYCHEPNSILKLPLSIEENSNPIMYYSKQNDCLRTEFSCLFNQEIVPTTFSFTEEAFDTANMNTLNNTKF